MKPAPPDMPDLMPMTVSELAGLAAVRPEWLDFIRDELRQRGNGLHPRKDKG